MRTEGIPRLSLTLAVEVWYMRFEREMISFWECFSKRRRPVDVFNDQRVTDKVESAVEHVAHVSVVGKPIATLHEHEDQARQHGRVPLQRRDDRSNLRVEKSHCLSLQQGFPVFLERRHVCARVVRKR